MKRQTLLLALLLIFNLFHSTAQDAVTLSEIDDYNGSGWKAVLLENGIIELLIIPEIGGRVLYYGFPDDEYMAVNDGQFGKDYNPDTDNSGPWTGDWGYGGYKVWTAPQDEWGWPPPPHLDWGNYTYTIEYNTTDSVVVYLESEEETTAAPGIVFGRRFKIYSNSTRVIIEQSITNKNNSSVSWSIWEVTQSVIQHGTEKDYSNFNVYFPLSKADIFDSYGGILSDVTQIEPGLSKFQYGNSSNSKFFTYLDPKGWVCFTDEGDGQSYAKIFDVLEGTHADGGANFELYAGAEYIEIEVLSPIVELVANGGNYSYIEEWNSAHLKGPIYEVSKAGAVSQKLNYSSADLTFTGEFGIFNTGTVELIACDSDNDTIFTTDRISVTAGEKISIVENYSGNAAPVKATVIAYDNLGNEISILASWEKVSSTINHEITNFEISVYPTLVNKNKSLFVDMDGKKAYYSLVNINGVKFQQGVLYYGKNEIMLPEIQAGTYILRLIEEEMILHQQKIIVLPN